jgi:hypothetical protein
MMRILVVSIFAALLANCSGSTRVEDIVPGWANTPPRGPAVRYAAPNNHLEGRATLAAEPRRTPQAEPQEAKKAEPQEAKKPEVQSPAEE